MEILCCQRQSANGAHPAGGIVNGDFTGLKVEEIPPLAALAPRFRKGLGQQAS